MYVRDRNALTVDGAERTEHASSNRTGLVSESGGVPALQKIHLPCRVYTVGRASYRAGTNDANPLLRACLRPLQKCDFCA